MRLLVAAHFGDARAGYTNCTSVLQYNSHGKLCCHLGGEENKAENVNTLVE